MILKIVSKYNTLQNKIFLDDILSVYMIDSNNPLVDVSDIVNIPIVLSNVVYELDRGKKIITFTGSTNSVYTIDDFMNIDNDLEVLSIGSPNSIPYVALSTLMPIYIVR